MRKYLLHLLLLITPLFSFAQKIEIGLRTGAGYMASNTIAKGCYAYNGYIVADLHKDFQVGLAADVMNVGDHSLKFLQVVANRPFHYKYGYTYIGFSFGFAATNFDEDAPAFGFHTGTNVYLTKYLGVCMQASVNGALSPEQGPVDDIRASFLPNIIMGLYCRL